MTLEPKNSTLNVKSETKNRLVRIKKYKRETIDEVIERILDGYEG